MRLLRVGSCDFVDRLLYPQDLAIHELIRTNINEAPSNAVYFWCERLLNIN